jgi:hypothetical protein
VEVAGSCENGKEHKDPITGQEFIDELSDYYILKMGSVP